MSYILEALRKADAQRERNRLPGLQAQPHATATARPLARSAWLVAGAAAVLGIGVVAAWQVLGGDPPPADEAAAAGTPAVALAQPAPDPGAAPAEQILPPAPPARPAPPPPPVPAPAVKAEKPEPLAPAPAPARAAAPSPALQATAAPAAASAEVSSTIPAGAPTLAIRGGVWSQNPAQRLLIVDGQVFNEGSELAPGVRLQEVMPQGAVLDFRGQRYSVPY